ncbi:MAG: hypothetical protein IJ173_10140, partial [Kiritimatiellae bacterium]|nr:hypothetical protein [Kiritimatiellia bacterium]
MVMFREIVVVFLANDLSAFDAEINLGREGEPRRPSLRISPRKNAISISQIAADLPREFQRDFDLVLPLRRGGFGKIPENRAGPSDAAHGKTAQKTKISFYPQFTHRILWVSKLHPHCNWPQ